jgi:hypothetical protein
MPIGEFNWYHGGEHLHIDDYTFEEVRLVNPSLPEIQATMQHEYLKSRIVKTNQITF